MPKIHYQPNQKINNLIFIKEVKPHIRPDGQLERKALFQCFCGKEFESQIKSVKSKNASSCGCYSYKELMKRNTTHGLRYHPLYVVWKNMKARCYNPKVEPYKNYGGRDISVCGEWRDDPAIFIGWSLGNGWEKGLEIDRINNDGNYEPENCRFVTSAVNNLNKRNNKKKE